MTFTKKNLKYLSIQTVLAETIRAQNILNFLQYKRGVYLQRENLVALITILCSPIFAPAF